MRLPMRRALLLVAVSLLLPPVAVAAWMPTPAPSDPRSMTWIEEGVLALGGGTIAGSNLDYLQSKGFGAVANFRADRNDDEAAIRKAGMEYLYIPIDHAVDMNATQLRTFVAWAKDMEAQGRPMYIHCLNGWHRGAVFAAAWLMERGEQPSADAAFAEVARLRPGSVLRAPSALLAYEAELKGERPLVVLLQSPLARPERGGSMPVEVEVLASGLPARGAKVHVWSEESGIDVRGRTDDEGRFGFTYVADLDQGMDHLYARAELDGHADGADDVQLFYESRVPTTRPLDIQTRRGPEGIEVQVLRGGKPHPARVLAWNADGWYVFDETGTGAATLPFPTEGSAIHLRAVSWGTLGDAATLRPPQTRGEPSASGEPREPLWIRTPPPADAEVGSPPPPDPTVSLVARAAPAALMGIGLLAGALVAMRLARRPAPL